MTTIRFVVALMAALVVPASAQPTGDHLKCYKVRDPQAKALYTADLGGLVPEPGCRIKVPAALACVPATKANVHPNPPGGGGTGTPNVFGCYKIKCLKAALPALQLHDQFGNRSVTPIAAKLLCAPAASPTTTTTSTTTSTTGVTVPCTATDCAPCSGGSCTTGQCYATGGATCNHPGGGPTVCIDTSSCVPGGACTTDADCATLGKQFCVLTGPMTGCCNRCN